MNNAFIEIDGSIGEAGGQILRTAVALAAATKKPCHIFNIRRGRPKTGLAAQHLLGLQALARLCNGKLEGDFLGSEEIKFWPGRVEPKDLSIKIETAGSIALVLQTLILPSLFAALPIKASIELTQKPSKKISPVRIIFKGGATDTFFSPTIDHLRYVFLKILEKMGARVEISISRRGYYPEGRAEVEIKVFPSKLKNLNLTKRGQLKRILAISGASEFLRDKKVAERQLAGVREVLGRLKLPLEEKAEYYLTFSPGSQICLIAEFENTVIGTDNLGKLGKRAEDVGKEAALELLREQKSEACLDKHLADQILPFLAMAEKTSMVTVSEVTDHCKTNIWVIEKFIKGEFKTEENLITWNPKEDAED
jgi:RNA 3'-phosphate cyclase